ncbi:MAG: ferrous iron transport protein B [Oscillospiraceae bacterium]|nr:ferrous iron transport protein B [Oscillospiraceae bacterium]
MKIKIALAGNPNCGKTTLFNALTGSNQFVGNWPGVTVEKKEGTVKGRADFTLTDLPGIYSLSPYTLEEVVARNYLFEEKPDVILDLVDGTNIERNLYLTTQLSELGIPMVVAVNMMDIVRKNGGEIKTAELSDKLGCAVVEISALKETGIDEAVRAAELAAAKKTKVKPQRFSEDIEKTLGEIEREFVQSISSDKRRWYAIKLFERDERVLAQLDLSKDELSKLEIKIKSAEKKYGDDAESIIANERYNAVAKITAFCCKRKRAVEETVSDKIDKVVTNRFAALPIFALIMFLVYYISVSTVGRWATGFMSGVFGDGFRLVGRDFSGLPETVGAFLDTLHCAVWLKSLVLEGIIGGVGSVLSFVPQMLVLFLFLAFLEACGYMSRIAFMMDRIFRRFGLSGKSFIPMLIGTGCSVPGIMASRTIENESDRRMTIMTTSFIPCGAKLPVIAMIASSMFSGAAWVAPSAYFAGILSVAVSGIMLKKTKLFADNQSPFVMELPAYHMPTVRNLLRSMWERGSSFIKKAGTVILLASIVVWAGSHFGYTDGFFGFHENMALEKSIIGTTGRAIALIFAPLGFGNVKAAIATIMGLLAKEEIVGVFGVLEFDSMSRLSAYSFLMFNLLCAPCVAAMGAIRREMNSAKWTAFALGYQTAFAYGVSLCIYQLGSALRGEASVFGILCAFAVIAVISYMLIRDGYGSDEAGERKRRIFVIKWKENRNPVGAQNKKLRRD